MEPRFREPPFCPGIWARNGTSPGLGDFNGDGNTDVLWQNTSGNMDVWSMNGLSLNSAVLSNGQIGAEWHVAATGDFFGTGRDAILWESDSGDLQSWSMNGANVVATANVGQIGAEWHVAGVGHFLNDGPTDIVWVNTNNDVQLWQMTNGVVTQYITPVGHDRHRVASGERQRFHRRRQQRLAVVEERWHREYLANQRQPGSVVPPSRTGRRHFAVSSFGRPVVGAVQCDHRRSIGSSDSALDRLPTRLGQHAAELPTFDHSLGGAGAEWHIFG